MILFLGPLAIFGQDEPFGNLNKIELDTSQNIYIKYTPYVSQIFNVKLGKLDKNDPFYSDFDEEVFDIKAIKTKVDVSSSDEYYIIFSYGISADPCFVFYKNENFNKADFSIPGKQIYIPGNGFIYISGHANNDFDTRRKFQLRSDSLVEIIQPFYYVGLTTKTLAPISLFETEDNKKLVAKLPVNYNIEVLLNKRGTSLYLIKTEFGLVGWTDLGYIGQKADKIDKIFFNGD